MAEWLAMKALYMEIMLHHWCGYVIIKFNVYVPFKGSEVSTSSMTVLCANKLICCDYVELTQRVSVLLKLWLWPLLQSQTHQWLLVQCSSVWSTGGLRRRIKAGGGMLSD